MSISTYKFIDPHTLAAISNLQLVAKTVVDGFMLGGHQSPKLGLGLEFNQYRSYQPGDDVRRIDWKMYARSDRYYVRESEVETSVSVRFILDATASMAHQDSGISKLDYARFLIASLAYLAANQGDAIGLHIISDGNVTLLPAKREHQHLHRFLNTLERVDARGRWPERQVIEKMFLASQYREIIVFVSDMHESLNEIQEAVLKLSALKNEVLLFHLMGHNELEFTFEGSLNFQDLETGETIRVDASRSRERTIQNIQERIQQLRQAAHDQHVGYELFSLNQPLDYALRNYLRQRIRR
ncbi:MAG: DUF58 domain-containing protein [bacterium]